MKRGPKLNLIKKIVKGGGGNPKTLTVSSLGSEFDKEAKSDKKVGRGGGGRGWALKPKQYARLCQMR